MAGARPRAGGKSADPRFETRCGWLSNPTPANLWLYGREAYRIIGEQGGYQLEGFRDWPEFEPRQWVGTDGRYGYGCACLRLRADKETRKVLEVRGVRVRPPVARRRDRSSARWKQSVK